jgi:hypothetical protein
MPKPTFLILGAMKAGTTALYTMLGAHPEVYVSPVKEPNFFAFAGQELDFQAPIDRRPDGINHTSITDWDEYTALFDGADPEQARGEASHTSLYWPDAAANVAQYVPEARLIAILRDPVERAYSEYMHFRRDGDEPIEDFEAALDAEPERIEQNWALGRYVDRGRYDEQLERYLRRFDRDQIEIVLHQDFVAAPSEVGRRLCSHIGVDPDVELPTERRVNASGLPEHPWMHRVLSGLQPVREALDPVLPTRVVDWANAVKNKNLDKPEMAASTRRRLANTFRPHVRRLEDLLDRDLSHWLGA